MRIIIYILFITTIVSCKKVACPDPVIISDTTTVSVQPKIDTSKNTGSINKYTIVLQPDNTGKDALLSGVNPDQSFPTHSYLHARTWTINGNLSLEKSIIQFDYSSIPADATITKAIVTFFADTTVNTGSIGHSKFGGPNDWTLKRVTQSWSESSVTWNNEPATDLNSSIQCPESTSESQAYELDVTSWVVDEISHPTLYYGFLMQLNSTDHYAAIYFCSTDHQYPALRPKMVIEYTR